tara:strand:+ start:6419 stop:6610 length:192 start_codon:yes stop_codon:yes gene_type:complete
MATTLSTKKNKETLSRLIRKEFDKIDFSMDYIYQKSDELIDLARSYGLDDLADEMNNDKNIAV